MKLISFSWTVKWHNTQTVCTSYAIIALSGKNKRNSNGIKMKWFRFRDVFNIKFHFLCAGAISLIASVICQSSTVVCQICCACASCTFLLAHKITNSKHFYFIYCKFYKTDIGAGGGVVCTTLCTSHQYPAFGICTTHANIQKERFDKTKKSIEQKFE